MAWNYVDDRATPQQPQQSGRWRFVDPERMGELPAAWRGFQDGLTFNLDDEFAGLVGGDAERDRVRAEQERARNERPGWYTAGSVGSAFVPFGGIGVASNVVRGADAAAHVLQGANALSAGARATSLGRNVFSGFKSLAGAAAGGAAYGTLNRIGDADGSLEDRLQEINPGTVATDAAYGAGGFAGLAGVGAAARGFGRALEQGRAQRAFDGALASARRAESSAEAQASAMAPYNGIDKAREDAFKRAVDEAITAQGANPQSLQSIAQRFGITLPRSMANADRNGREWLWEAYDGVHGPAARGEAQRIITRLFDQAPDAFMNVVENGPKYAPATAQEGASEVRTRLQMRNELERQTETQAWNAFNPRAAAFKFSQRGSAGLPTLAREIDARLVDRRVFFDHPNPEMADVYRRMYPRAALARDAVKLYVDGVARGKPGTLEDVVNLRRFISDAYQAARDDADRGAVYAVQKGLDDWLEHSMGANIRQSGKDVAAQFDAANLATQRNRELFVDNKHVAKMTAEEGDAERALATLIGTRGVQPQNGAHLTMRALRQRLGADSDTWRMLKLTILRRFSDPLEEALNRDNPRAFNTVYNQLDDFLRKHNEFIVETFSPNERLRLAQLHGVLRQMQTPGPGAANASRSGVTLAHLMQSIIPGGKFIGDTWRDAVMAPRAARQQLEQTTRPEVLGPALRAALGGVFMGPESFWLGAGAGAMQDRGAQDRDRRELLGTSYGY